jgi:thiol-disulfide isomerase/thioredoxin
MMRATCWPWGAATVAVLVMCGVAAGTDARQPMPNFKATTLDGEKYTNDAVKGKVVLLQFWATWCQYCRRDQEAVDMVAKEFADKGLLVLAVDAGESKRTVKQYLAKTPRAVPIVLMENTNLAAMFAAKSYPLYVLIDADGNIAGELRGAGGERALRQLLSKAGLE